MLRFLEENYFYNELVEKYDIDSYHRKAYCANHFFSNKINQN